ncbi:hypothetical protein PVAP13_8KG076536 [Panicum virgatum]|uniref:Uncharacterized protein n=1 Tax=Panicum virgatum TaxID=38727 RepID=A0A8T0PFI2_PANVG|nr:hypothetical protein PVAP13_8KG076536 [Panicum virgatum]
MNSLTDISNQNEEQQAKVQRLKPISGGSSSSSRRRARRRRRRRLRLDVDGVLHDGLPGGGAGVDGVRLHVPARHPELAAAADDAHLADVGEHLVPAQDREAAALVLAGGEHEVHHHQEPERALVRERVGALGAPDLGPRGAGRPRGERVVDGHHRAEEGGGGVGGRRLRDADRRRARPAHDVVEVELERREPAVARRGGRRRGHRRRQGDGGAHEQELAAAAGHGGGDVGDAVLREAVAGMRQLDSYRICKVGGGGGGGSSW